MKNTVLFLTLALALFLSSKLNAQELISGPAISVDKTTHDYGALNYGANGECEFTIKNSGTEPLLITDARPSCGCTVPVFPKEPIAPGKSATIKVSYDTKREGDFQKSITIMSNASNEPTKVVYIKGSVAPNPEGVVPGVVPSSAIQNSEKGNSGSAVIAPR